MHPHRVVQRDTGKHRKAQPVVGKERTKATVAVACADKPEVIAGECHGDCESRPEYWTQHAFPRDPREPGEIDRVTAGNSNDVEASECQRGRAHAKPSV